MSNETDTDCCSTSTGTMTGFDNSTCYRLEITARDVPRRYWQIQGLRNILGMFGKLISLCSSDSSLRQTDFDRDPFVMRS
jgi:hypothetical protein